MNKENCVIANNDEWLQTPSPFDVIDEDMKIIIIFFVFHIPVEGVSARGKSLKEYGWGKKSKTNDFKELKRRLIEFGEMNEKYFVCEDNFEKLKSALTKNQLIDFPKDIENQKVVFKKDKSSMIDSLIFHIRNAFAHGRVALYKNGQYIVMEDINPKSKVISARMILKKETLMKWIYIIRKGPLAEENELKKELKME